MTIPTNRHRFASVYYKLVYKNRIVAAGSKAGMKKLLREYVKRDPDSKPFVGIGSPNEAEIGRIWNPALPAF